jgi:hypothetical protein
MAAHKRSIPFSGQRRSRNTNCRWHDHTSMSQAASRRLPDRATCALQPGDRSKHNLV